MSLHGKHPDIIDSFEDAYDRAAAPELGQPRESIYLEAACLAVSQFACANLIDRGYASRIFMRELRSGGAHHYLRLSDASDDKIADGTWQQFLPEAVLLDDNGAANIPKVLVGTPQEVAGTAYYYGVPEELTGFWRNNQSDNVVKEYEYPLGVYVVYDYPDD